MSNDEIVKDFENARLRMLELFDDDGCLKNQELFDDDDCLKNQEKFGSQIYLTVDELLEDHNISEDSRVLINELAFDLPEAEFILLVDELLISNECKSDLLSYNSYLNESIEEHKGDAELQEIYIAAQSQESYLTYSAKNIVKTEIGEINKFATNRLRGLVLSMISLDIEIDNSILKFLVMCLPAHRISPKAIAYGGTLSSIETIQEIDGDCSFYSACKSYWKFLRSNKEGLSKHEQSLASKDFNIVYDLLKVAKRRSEMRTKDLK